MKNPHPMGLVCTAALAVATARAELLVYDSFEQARPGELTAQETGAGFSGGYVDTGVCTAVLDPSSRMVYENGDLKVDGGTTRMRMQPTAVGDKLVWGRALSPLPAPEGDGPLYMSFLLRVSDSVAQEADEDSILFGITTATSANPLLGLNIAKHSSGSGNAIGIRSNSSNLVTGCPALEGDRTYLLVFKWYKSNGYYRGFQMVVDPTTVQEPETWLISKDSGINKPLSDYQAITCYFRKSCEVEDTFEIDEFRLGTSWADVTGAPTYNGVVPRPAVSIAEGATERLVTITQGMPGVTCYYTLDGSVPTAETGTLYTAPFALTQSADVKAVAVDGEGRSSAVTMVATNFETHWTGAGADDNWLTAENWLPQGSPANKALVFGAEDRTLWGKVNNVIDDDIVVRSICFTNNNFGPVVTTANYDSHVGTIAAGKTLKVTSMDADGYSLRLTSPRGGWNKNSHVQAAFSGGGTFAIDSPESQVYLSCNSSSAYTTTLLDLTGLGAVDWNVDTIYVGHLARTIGRLLLAKNGSNTVTARVLTVGDSHGTIDAPAAASELSLGQTNVLNVDLLGLASSERGYANTNSGKMSFAAGLTEPTVKIRGRDGVGRAEVRVGGHGQGGDVGMKSAGIEGVLDFSAGTVDALIDGLYVARGCGRKYDGSNNGGAAKGVVKMSAGTMDVNDVSLVYSVYHSKSQDPSCLLATGELDVSGGSFLVNNDLDAANNNLNAVQGVTATVNLTGGSIAVGRDLLLASRHGYASNVIARVNVSGGTLAVAGRLVGGTDNLNYMKNYPAEKITVSAEVNALGGEIAVTNLDHTAELKLEKGVLTLAGGKVLADALDLSAATSRLVAEVGTDFQPVTVTTGGAVKLGGALAFAFKDGQKPAGQSVFPIVSGGVVEGRFTSVDLPSGYKVRYTANGVTVGKFGLIVVVQ